MRRWIPPLASVRRELRYHTIAEEMLLLEIYLDFGDRLLCWVLIGEYSIDFLQAALKRLVSPVDGIREGGIVTGGLASRHVSDGDLHVL